MAFEKKEWQYRDLISADELNRVEDGIQEALDTEGANLSAVNESIQSEANTRQAADEEEAKTREEEDTAIRSEMQSGLDEKVDKANVVNNLDVTDDGYVLDARVGAQIKEEIASGGTSDLITDVFMEQDSYSAGDYCIYNNVLYKFTADKEPGAWDESVVEATTVGAEIQENTDLIDSSVSEIKSMYLSNAQVPTNSSISDYYSGLSRGYYSVFVNNAITDTPVSANFIGMIFKYDDTSGYIMLLRISNSVGLYIRRLAGGSWGDWYSATVSSV